MAHELYDFRFERPERRVVTETVQPRTSSQTALTDPLNQRRDYSYQSTASNRGVSIAELQIRGGIEDNSKKNFFISQGKCML